MAADGGRVARVEGEPERQGEEGDARRDHAVGRVREQVLRPHLRQEAVRLLGLAQALEEERQEDLVWEAARVAQKGELGALVLGAARLVLEAREELPPADARRVGVERAEDRRVVRVGVRVGGTAAAAEAALNRPDVQRTQRCVPPLTRHGRSPRSYHVLKSTPPAAANAPALGVAGDGGFVAT